MSKRKWKILGVDHVAFAARSQNFDMWKNFLVCVFLGTEFYDISDANPDGNSSMRLCGIKIGNLSIALIAGIDREKKSQVTKFVERHGEGFQHIAIAVRNIELFLKEMREKGVGFLEEVKIRDDSWGGQIKQIFGLPLDATIPLDEASFFEFVERPQKGKTFSSGESFSDDFAKKLYEEVEKAAQKRTLKGFIPPV